MSEKRFELSSELALTLQAKQNELSELAACAVDKPLARPETKQPTTVYFSHKSTRHLNSSNPQTAEEKRKLEDAIFGYIASKTDYLKTQKGNEKILRQYIELYVYNPSAYPIVPGHKIHPLIHEAGDAVLQAKQQAKQNPDSEKKNNSPCAL